MLINENITPRALSPEEKENRKKGIYDSFANYLVLHGTLGDESLTSGRDK